MLPSELRAFEILLALYHPPVCVPGSRLMYNADREPLPSRRGERADGGAPMVSSGQMSMPMTIAPVGRANPLLLLIDGHALKTAHCKS